MMGLLALMLLLEARRQARVPGWEPDAPLRAGPRPLGPWPDLRGTGPGPAALPAEEPARAVPAAGRHQRGPQRRPDLRRDRLVADRPALQPAAGGRPDSGGRAEPSGGGSGAGGAGRGPGPGRRLEAGRLPPVPRRSSRPAPAARAGERGWGGLRRGDRPHVQHGGADIPRGPAPAAQPQPCSTSSDRSANSSERPSNPPWSPGNMAGSTPRGHAMPSAPRWAS